MLLVTSLPDWLYPAPPGGWTADDLDAPPPDAPRHVELIDGALILMSPQTSFHMLMLGRLENGIRPPEGLYVAREMSVRLGTRQRPEPDIMVVTSPPESNLARTYYEPHEVRLVAEVASPEPEDRDRETKPVKYAKAGIRFLWRVELEGRTPVAFTYELDPASGKYVPTGVHRGHLKTDIGFLVDIDLTIRA
jgi:Uma2 family endonuclease